MAFVAENNLESRMFVPIPDNPLHLASSSKNPLFLLGCSPSPPLVPIPLQKKSSLKDLKDNTPNSYDIKHTVRWSSPISISRMIPPRESGTINLSSKLAIPAQTTSIVWSISQSLTLNERTQCGTTTLFELDLHFSQRERKGSTSVLSFPRPRPLSIQSKELQARMNLMHLQKVIRPKIPSLSSLTSNAFTKQSPKYSSKAPTNTKTSRRRVIRDPVFRPATINIPRHPRPNQYPTLRLKRRSTTPDHKRPRKVAKTDENTSAAAFREFDAPATDADEVPSLKPVNQSLDPGISDVGSNSSAEPPSSDDDSSDDDDEALSDGESLIGDHKLSVERSDVTRSTRFKNSVSQTHRSRRPLNSIKVVNWTNGLKRFQYLLQNKKMDWRCDDELYELLKGIYVEKDNITIELLKKTQVGKMIRDLSKSGNFEERSTILAKEVYISWRNMCRAVEQ